MATIAPFVFGLFTAIGALFILCAKFLGMPSFVVTGVPIGWMALYALLIVGARGLRLRDDQTGDNFYYMGFIFTLVSLGVSLYQYSSGGGIDEIVRNFGVAVGSTIAGIVLRIMFNQVRRDPIEVEHTSRLELAEAARRVRRELEGVQYEIAHFRRSSLQMLKEGHDETRAQLSSLATGAVEAVRSASQEAVDTLRQSTDGLGSQLAASDIKSQIDKTARSLDRITKKIDTSSERLAAAAETLAVRLGEVAMPDRVIEVTMQPAVESLERVLTVLVTRLEQQTLEAENFRRDIVATLAVSSAAKAAGPDAAPTDDSADTAPARAGFMGGLLRRRQVDDPGAQDHKSEPS